ncbi:MAG TPA: OsmC family protein [Sphingomicrobium sp.]|nr:OsmC family protein [Sphingomicrobium sp.]
MLDTVKNRVNGLDLNALGEVVEAIQQDATQAKVSFDVTTRWTGQTRSETVVDGFTIAGNRVARTHKIVADEPCELLGGDSAPNPQELLMAAVNACMTVGYVAGAALHGITLDSLEIATRGTLDLRGFLGLDDTVPPGYEAIDYDVRIKGNGTPEQFEEIHQTVMKTSPNYFNISRPIRMNGTLRVG